MMVIAALSAITAVTIAAAIAPGFKIAVAWTTFLTGATIAGLIDKPESFAAITAGLVGIAGVTIFQRNKAPNKSSKRTPQSGAA